METKFEQFRVGDIEADPFRDLEGNPHVESKIAALQAEFRDVGFWGTLVGRIGPDGRPQIAFGHHRLEALRREFGPDFEIALEIRDLSDEAMIQLMVQENRDDWDSDAGYELEAVRVVVEQHAAGTIELPPPSPRTAKSSLRFAPSFLLGGPDGRGGPPTMRYTATTVAEYLRWELTKIKDALRALELVERGVVDVTVYSGLSPAKAREVTTAAGQAYEPTRAWMGLVGVDPAPELQEELQRRHEAGVREAAKAVDRVLNGAKRPKRPDPPRGVVARVRPPGGPAAQGVVDRFAEDGFNFGLGVRQVLEFSGTFSDEQDRVLGRVIDGVRVLLDELEEARR